MLTGATTCQEEIFAAPRSTRRDRAPDVGPGLCVGGEEGQSPHLQGIVSAGEIVDHALHPRSPSSGGQQEPYGDAEISGAARHDQPGVKRHTSTATLMV